MELGSGSRTAGIRSTNNYYIRYASLNNALFAALTILNMAACSKIDRWISAIRVMK